MLSPDLGQPDGAGIHEIEPVDVVRDRALAVLHEAQRAAARQHDVLPRLLRGRCHGEKAAQTKNRNPAKPPHSLVRLSFQTLKY